MRKSIGDDRESGKAMEKLSLVREKQCKMREKLESAKRAKMWGGESGCRSSCDSESCKWKYTNIFKGSLVLLGMFPRPTMKGEGRQTGPNRRLPLTSQRGMRKTWYRIVMVKGWW